MGRVFILMMKSLNPFHELLGNRMHVGSSCYCVFATLTTTIADFKTSRWSHETLTVTSHTHTRSIAPWLGVLPRTTRTPPTGVRSSGQGKPFYWLVCEDHVTDKGNRRRMSRGQATASSSSAQYDTEHPLHRSESTHSNRWSPTLEDTPSQCRTHVWAQVWSESHSNCHRLQCRRIEHRGRSSW